MKQKLPETKEEAQALYDSHASCYSVGKAYGWGKDKAFLMLKKLGVQFRKRGGATNKRAKKKDVIYLCSEEHLKNFPSITLPRRCLLRSDDNCAECRIRHTVTTGIHSSNIIADIDIHCSRNTIKGKPNG